MALGKNGTKNHGSVARNSIFNVIHTLVKLLFPLLTSIYVARVLSVDGVGKVTTANNLVSYFTAFAALGIPTYGLREIARMRGKSQQKDRLFTQLLVINAVSTVVCACVYLVLISIVGMYAREWQLYLCTGLLIVFNFINIDWLYKGNEEYAYITIRSIIIKVISLTALVLLVKKEEDYILYAVLTVLGSGANYIFNIINARKYVKLDFTDFHIRPHMRSIGYLFIGTFFTVIYSKIDITMLSIISGEAYTAYYSYAFRIVEMALLGCTAISEVFLPRLSYCYANDQQEFFKILRNGIQVLVFLAFPMTVGVIILAPEAIMLLYGPDFMPAAVALRIMAVLIIVKSLGDLVCYQLAICTGNEKKRLPAYFVAAVANIILNVALIPYMAHTGAVIATVASELIVNVFVFLSMRKIVAVTIPVKATVLSLVSSGIMGVAVWLVEYMPMNRILRTLMAISAGVIVYFATNWILGNPVLRQFGEKIREVLRNRRHIQ